jgi:hypothetical protein
MSPWEVPLQFVVDTSDKTHPAVATIRLEVTPPADPATVIFTADLPASTTEFLLPVGEGTSIPQGAYALRLCGISAGGVISDEYSCWLNVSPPAPDKVTLAVQPVTRIPAVPTPTPTP